MLVGDMVYSDDVSFNSDYKIYDCSEDEEGGELLFDTRTDGRRPISYILDMEVRYIAASKDGVIAIGAVPS